LAGASRAVVHVGVVYMIQDGNWSHANSVIVARPPANHVVHRRKRGMMHGGDADCGGGDPTQAKKLAKLPL
jgi:hypothetical protein